VRPLNTFQEARKIVNGLQGSHEAVANHAIAVLPGETCWKCDKHKRLLELIDEMETALRSEIQAAADEGVAAGAICMSASFGRALAKAGLHEIIAKVVMDEADDALSRFFAGAEQDKMTTEMFQRRKREMKDLITKHRTEKGKPA